MMTSHIDMTQRVLTLQDRSKYFLGLLLISASDRFIHPHEQRRLREVASLLDFAPDFCDSAIDNVLYNQFILDKPIKFSSRSVTKTFLEDALHMALADGNITSDEWEWLESVALINEIPLQWLAAEKTKVSKAPPNFSWAAAEWWPGVETVAETLCQQ